MVKKMDKTWGNILLSSYYKQKAVQVSYYVTEFPPRGTHAPWLCCKCAEILTPLCPYTFAPVSAVQIFFPHFLDGWWCIRGWKATFMSCRNIWELQWHYLGTACVWWSSVRSLESVIKTVNGNILWLYFGKRTDGCMLKRIASTGPVDKEGNFGNT